MGVDYDVQLEPCDDAWRVEQQFHRKPPIHPRRREAALQLLLPVQEGQCPSYSRGLTV